MLIGYARVSTQDQNLELQTEALEKAGCKKIFEDKVIEALAARFQDEDFWKRSTTETEEDGPQ